MDKIYIVMDYVEHDLKSLMETMKDPFMIGTCVHLVNLMIWMSMDISSIRINLRVTCQSVSLLFRHVHKSRLPMNGYRCR